MKISEIIEKLRAFHPPIDETHTSDVVKFGDPGQECTGVIVTVYASVSVIRAAIERKANFIIVHEPLFYGDKDDTAWLEGNSVYEEKARLLREGNIVVWRDHDHIHGGPPTADPKETDLIFYGIMKTLGWEKYLAGNPKKPLVYEIPETTVETLARELTRKLHLNGARIIGHLEQKVKRCICANTSTARTAAGIFRTVARSALPRRKAVM